MNIDTQSHTGQRLQRYQWWTKAPQRDLFSRQARWSLQIKSVSLLNHWALVAWFVILNFYGYLSCDLLLSEYAYTKMPGLYSLSEFVDKSSVKSPSLMVWNDFHFFRTLLPSPPLPPTATFHPSAGRNQRTSQYPMVAENSTEPSEHLIYVCTGVQFLFDSF